MGENYCCLAFHPIYNTPTVVLRECRAGGRISRIQASHAVLPLASELAARLSIDTRRDERARPATAQGEMLQALLMMVSMHFHLGKSN